MSGTFNRHPRRHKVPALVPTLAIAGFSLAIAVASAIPAAASAGVAHHAASTHHSVARHPSAKHPAGRHHSKRLVLKGLVAAHHGRTVTVFAKTATVGGKTRHNQRIKLVFAHSAHARTKIPAGDHLQLVARGVGSWHVFRIRHNSDESVSSESASLLFGTVTAVNGDFLTVSENDRDNGDHHRGKDCHGHGHGVSEDSTPADHGSRGGHGGHGGGKGDHHGHQITVDDTNAAITVDGAEGAITVGDTVAILGEVTDNTVVASTIYAFSTAPAFMRGEVESVSGDNVTVRDRGTTTTVSLTGVPLALNGDVGATPSELVAGDKLLLVGTLAEGTNQLIPEVAFAFNHHDDHPCGDNEGGGHHGHDGGSDG